MPTIDQLPQATAVSPLDQVMVEQGGTLMATSVDVLLADTEPKLTLAHNTLLGRVGVQPGGPEPVGIGPGLMLDAGQLRTDGAFLAPADSPAFTGTPTAPTQPLEDDSNAIATTAFVQQHTAQASPVRTVAGRTGYVTLDAGDIGGLASVATSGEYDDLAGRPAADHFNVLDFAGAVADGVTDTTAAINAAIAAAAAAPNGGTVLLPAGTWRIDLGHSYIRARSNVVLMGAGRGRTVLLVDDAAGAPAVPGYGGGLSNVVPTGTPGSVVQSFGASFAPLSDFHLRALTLRGRGDTLHSPGAQMLSLVGTNLSVVDCAFEYSRAFGMVIRSSDQVSVRGCRVLRSNADGIALWDVSNAVVTDNIIIGANDDAISAHSSNAAPVPVRSGLVIANNLIEESQGIKVLGAKIASITGNVLRRMMGYGIFVGKSSGASQGGTPVMAVRVSGNIITDVFRRSEPNWRNLEQYYIRIEGSAKNAGPGASAPGEPAPGSGVPTPLYGSGSGALYVNNTSNSTIASPGGWWIEVTDNQLLRTLPAPSAISDWGYDPQGLWVGNNGDGSGFYNGAITESSMNTRGIYIGPALHNALFARNLIETSGARAIEFFDANGGAAIVDGAFQDIAFEDNRISDFSDAAIWWPTPAVSRQRIAIRRNLIDGDPQFRSANRGPGGTWTSAAGPVGLQIGTLSGAYVAGNHFRNLANPIASGTGVNNTLGNVAHGTPAALGFSTANKGIGTVTAAGPAWSHVIEEADPAAPLYGQTLNQTVTQASAMPESGLYVAGHVVARPDQSVVNGQTLLGWKRLSTGSAHVAGVDWQPLYATSGAVLVTPGGNLAELANPAAALATLGGAPLASPALSGTPTAPSAPARTSSSQIATTAYVVSTLASPPAIGSGTPAAGSFTNIAVGGATPTFSAGGDPNGNIALGRYGVAGTPYMDFRGNNIASGYSVRMISDAAGQLTMFSSTGGLTVRVNGTLTAYALAIAGATAATQPWVAAQNYQPASQKGAPGGYAALDAAGTVPAAQLPSALLGGLSYQGAWNAATNTPALASGSGTTGAYYTVAAAGTTALDGVSQWDVGDHVAFNGSVWQKIPHAPADVVSVAGRTGVVSLAAADIAGLGPLATQGAGATAITGGTLAGITSLQLANPAGSGAAEGAAYALSAPAGVARQIMVQSAGVNRWGFGADAAGEMGGAAGSDFRLVRFDDSGAVLGSALAVSRASGAVDVGGALSVAGQPVALQSWVAAQGYERPANKGQAGGYAALDATGRVPLGQLPGAITGAMSYQGGWDAAANLPALASGVGTRGFYYVVTTAGTTALDGVTAWAAGDQLAFNGVAWQRLPPARAGVETVVLTADASAITVPAGARALTLQLWGPGGGGGGGAQVASGVAASGGGGGGGGGHAEAEITIGSGPGQLPAGATLSAVVPAGGAGGAAGAAGAAAAATTVSFSTGGGLVAGGGGGGAAGRQGGNAGGGGGGSAVASGGSGSASAGGSSDPAGGGSAGAATGAAAAAMAGGGGGGGGAAAGPGGAGGLSLAAAAGGGAGGGIAAGGAAQAFGPGGRAVPASAAGTAGASGHDGAPGAAGGGGAGGAASGSGPGGAGGAGGFPGGGGGGGGSSDAAAAGAGAAGAGGLVLLTWRF